MVLCSQETAEKKDAEIQKYLFGNSDDEEEDKPVVEDKKFVVRTRRAVCRNGTLSTNAMICLMDSESS